MMSDVCKHCDDAPCLEVCPTGAILRTEFDTVYINPPACNGCRDCISACPFGVIHMSGRRHRPEMHLLLRPPQARTDAGLRPGLPDPVDPLRPADQAQEEAAGPRCAVASSRARQGRTSTAPTTRCSAG